MEITDDMDVLDVHSSCLDSPLEFDNIYVFACDASPMSGMHMVVIK